MTHFTKKLSKTILFTALLLAGAMILSQPISAQAEGEVGVWHFDENTGTVAADSSGNNTGTLVNGPVWTAGKVGSALQFDGIDDYVNAGNGASLNITNAITVSAWVKTTSKLIVQLLYIGMMVIVAVMLLGLRRAVEVLIGKLKQT